MQKENQPQLSELPASILEDKQQNFYIKQLYTGCLAEAAYYIESNQEAVVIDPLRDTQAYINLANQRKAQIKYVLLTHFHADFISGHLDLAQETGATIVYGPTAEPNFKCHVAKDNEEISLGNIKIKVLHTPGHTIESSTYLILDQNKPYCIFTGDTLFLGEVGRPDLAVKSGQITKEDLAGWLFDSLNNRIVTLPDEVIVYPGHGAGSSCGKNISSGTHDTLGNQKKTNYALQIKDRNEFVKQVSSNLPTPPGYFFYDATLNKQGYENLKEIVARNKTSLPMDKFQSLVNEGYIIVDSRPELEFLVSFIKGSISLDLQGSYAAWAGKLIPPESNLIIVTPEGKEEEAIIRLARIGYDKVAGYLEGGIEAWKNAGKELQSGTLIEAKELEKLYNQDKTIQMVDVRTEGEKHNGYIKGIQLCSLWELENELKKNENIFNKTKPIYTFCQSGKRSLPAISILNKYGYQNLHHIKGGLKAIQQETNIQISYE